MAHHLLLLGDSHGGHTHGLLNPAVELQQETADGDLIPYQPELRAVQQWLWYEVYLPALEKVKAHIGNDPLSVIHMGDVTHGVKRSEELVTTRMSDQIEIGVANYAPILALENVQRIEHIIGTGSHEMQEGAAAYLVGKRLEALSKKPVEVMLHLYAQIGEKIVDASHHGPTPGTRIWLAGNMARFYLRDRVLSEGNCAADIYARAHYHSPVWEQITGDNWRKYHLVVTPPLCTPGAWTRQATRSVQGVEAGMVVASIDGNHIEVNKFTEKIDLRTKRVWQM